MMIDYDPGNHTPLTPSELVEKLIDIWPELKDSAYVLAASASSHLYNKESGKCLKGDSGLRILVRVKHGTDIKRALDVLFKRS